jgi:cysteine-rich repeat protein
MRSANEARARSPKVHPSRAKPALAKNDPLPPRKLLQIKLRFGSPRSWPMPRGRIRFGPVPSRVLSKLSLACLGGALFSWAASACLDWSKLDNGACGDGFVGREEACDDGNRISGDGCSDTCTVEPAVCGDGRVDLPGEKCDDANALNSDACLTTCQPAECGDGQLYEFEEACDDGNTTDGDGCSRECTLEPRVSGPPCGDGALDADEVCDDGNASNFDSCLNGCSFATCGDGYVRQGVEECDYGKTDMPCSHGCLVCGDTADSYFRAGNTHCYVVHAMANSEEQARSVCQAEGGDLWTVTSEAEGTDVTDKLSLTGQLWLGLLTNGTGNTWVSGENTKYTSFAAGEPSDTGLRCVAFDATAHAWHSEACASELGFVCERTPGFVFPDTHHGYRLHTSQVDADAARASCVADGGYLAQLQTTGERAFVGKGVNIPVWLEASDSAVEGQFVWQSGEPVDRASFATGQPDDSDGSQNCLALNAGARFVDAKCNEHRAFICEFD